MKTKSQKRSLFAHSTPLNNSTTFISKLNVLRQIGAARGAAFLALVAVMAVVAYTTSSASPTRTLLGGGARSSVASKPGAAKALAATARKASRAQDVAGQKAASDPILGQADLNIERRGHTATQLADGRLLIVGGENDGGLVKKAETFDPNSRSFLIAAKLKASRKDHTATGLNDGRVLVAGGRNLDLLNSTEIFDPAKGVFDSGPSLNRARAGHSATTLKDGRILIVGGDDQGSAEIYDPQTGTFTLLEASLSAPRSFHSAVLLRNGKVLIAGGLAQDKSAIQYGEIFDPQTLSFSSTANSMHGVRTRPTLRVLDDGKVQVIGGDDERSMEMFNADGKYFTAYARLLPGSSPVSTILRAQTRAGIIHETTPGDMKLQSALPAALEDLLDRGEHSLTEMPQAGSAVIAGGASGSGRVLKSVVILSASSATVTTDKTDYAPGETVIITGTGWLAGETVQLTLHRDNETPDTVLSAVANPDGNFTNSEYVIQDGDIGVTFLLTATGQSSTWTAQTTFTDGLPTRIQTATMSPSSGTCGAIITVSATLEYKVSNPNNFAALAGKTVAFTLGTSTGSGVTGADGVATASLTVPAGATSLVASFAGDSTYNSVSSSITFTVTGSCCTASTDPASATSSANNFCAGTSTDLSVSGGSLGTGASWHWYSGSCGGTSAGTGATISVSPAATTTYYVRAEGDCNTTACASVTVTVKTASTDPASATSSANNFCPGGSTTLSVVGGTLGTGASWHWYSGGCGGTSAGTGATISVSPAVTTTYFVRAEGDCNTTACASVTVTVKTASTDPASATSSANNFCAGTSTDLSVSGGSLGTGASWHWYSGSCGGTSAGTGATISVSPAVTTTYFVRAEGDCNTTACASVTVTVKTASTDPASATSSANNFCAGTSTDLSVSGGSLGTGASWKWYSGSCGGTSAGTGATISVSPAATTTYYVRAEGDCNTTACSSVTVTVKTASTDPASATSSANNFCPGGSTTLSVVGGTLGTGASWHWYSGGCGGTSAGTGATISVSPAVTTTYFVRAEGDCNTTLCASVTVTVKTLSTPPTGASASVNPICLTGSTTLSVVGGTLGNGASWKWYSGSCGGTSEGVGATITVSPTATTTYYVRAEGDCNNTACASVTVTVNFPPMITSVSGPVGPIAKGTSTGVTVNFTGPLGLAHSVGISWDDTTTSNISLAAGVFTTGLVSHTYNTAGVYTVAVTVSNVCGSSATYTFQYIVVYDPNGGFVTGGGWIISPLGAYVPDPSLTGRANFGFVSKYQRGASVPTGETEFQFQLANLNFHSTVYEWLVISGAKGQYKGSGTINGAGNYGFLLTATDGQVNGGGGVDKFRIKIWDKDNNGAIVYDNAPGSDDIDASAQTAISGGSITIHK